MIVKDPDMLIAWFGNFADVPMLLKRCCALGINPMQLSPIGRVEGVKKTSKGFEYTKGDEGFSSIKQPIGGRITLNLDHAFERQWNDSQRGTLPSLALDYVSSLLFGEGKSKKQSLPTPMNSIVGLGWKTQQTIWIMPFKMLNFWLRLMKQTFVVKQLFHYSVC